MATLSSKNIGVSVNCSSAEVYSFASNPENLPKWASGLGGAIQQINNEWISESPMGKVKIRFSEKNKFGILDHFVTLESGVEFYNPMRVFPNNKGSEVVFTLFRQPDMTDQKFEEDQKWITTDLEKLRDIMEKNNG